MEGADHSWQTVMEATAAQLDQMGERAWIVGGCLRDALVGRPVRDVDLAVTGDPHQLARALLPSRGLALVPLKRQTVRLVLRTPAGASLDLAPLRGGSPADDLRTRDFTINALALPLSAARAAPALFDAAHAPRPTEGATLPAPAALLDPLGGYADLRARRLVLVSEHALRDDPLRILRAARLAADLSLTVPPATLRLLREAAPLLTRVAPERVGGELALLFRLVGAEQGWRLLAAADALPPLFPALAQPPAWPPEAAVAHLLAAQAAVTPLHPAASADTPDPARLRLIPGLRAWYAGAESRLVHLRWGVLAHALAPHPPTLLTTEPDPSRLVPAHTPSSLTPALAASAHATATRVARGWLWARHLLLVDALEMPAWRRFFARLAPAHGTDGGEPAIHAIVTALACQAALAAGGGVDQTSRLAQMAARAQDVLAGYLAQRQRWLPKPLLTGADLIHALGIPPGPRIGQLLAQIREAQLDERVTTREDALRLARVLASHAPDDAG